MMSANFVDSMKLIKYTSEAHLLKSIGTGSLNALKYFKNIFS